MIKMIKHVLVASLLISAPFYCYAAESYYYQCPPTIEVIKTDCTGEGLGLDCHHFYKGYIYLSNGRPPILVTAEGDDPGPAAGLNRVAVRTSGELSCWYKSKSSGQLSILVTTLRGTVKPDKCKLGGEAIVSTTWCDASINECKVVCSD